MTAVREIQASGDLATRLRALLAPFLSRAVYAPGALLWREGDESGRFVSIETGRVKAYRVLPDGNAVTLYLFGPGDVIGFMPLLEGRPYPASAQALTEVIAFVMPRSDLLAAFQRDPQVALALVSLLGRRLREAFDRIERSSIADVLPRVAAALVSLVPGESPAGTLRILELPVRSRDLAEAIGVAPESFSRAVTKLVASGVLHRLGPRRYQVLDVAALRRISGESAL